jgi:hypothetical protein
MIAPGAPLPRPSDSPTRTAKLGDSLIELEGSAPVLGSRLRGEFAIAPARHARAPLLASDLRAGWVVLSTLPNIEKHACIVQILDLEEAIAKMEPRPRLVHVSADEAHHWHEVDHIHPHLKAPGYTLASTSSEDRAAFTSAFGVGVRGKQRIAHGLFGLRDGTFENADIPYDQMGSPNVVEFVARLRSPKSRR